MSSAQTPVSLLRRPDVESRTGLSRTELYRRMKAGSFPAPITLGPQIVAWPSNKIDAWIEEQIAQAARQ